MAEFRTAPVRSHIQAAVESFYCEVADRLESNNETIQPQDMEELLLHLTAQHFLAEMDSQHDAGFIEKRLQRFEQRLESTVQKELERRGQALDKDHCQPF